MGEQKDFWPRYGLPSNAEARAKRDQGIERATQHAERVAQEWNDSADFALRNYLDFVHGVPFLSEEFVAWVRARDLLPMPPDGRAWGGVIRRAAIAHAIEKAGAAPANTSNRSLKILWRQCEDRP
jgi:hypothetical protein